MPEQAPGYYRHALGDVVVTALNDGILAEDVGVLDGIGAEAAVELLSAAFLPARPILTVNAFLLQRAGRAVLIDAGCGTGMGPDAGRLLRNLRHAGLSPGDIDDILLTHMHPDHIGGLLDAAGKPAFPRARIRAPAADAAFFLDAAIAANAPEPVRPVFAKARAVAAAYGERFASLAPDDEPMPGIRAVGLPGHSPGHTGYRVTTANSSLLIWGDVVHVPAIQLRRPEVGMIFDADPALSRKTRRDTLAAAAADRELVGGMHLPFPALGHLEASESGYRFVPTLWTPIVADGANP